MDDFSKIMEDAKRISEMMEGSGSAEAASFSGSNPMFANMANIVNLMELMKSFQSIGKREPPAAPAPVEKDDLPGNIKALNAMAPYMDSANRKNMLIAAKLMELMYFVNTMEVEAAGVRASGQDSRNMLIAARPYIDRDKQDMIDLLITVMDISEILRKMERMNQINVNKF